MALASSEAPAQSVPAFDLRSVDTTDDELDHTDPVFAALAAQEMVGTALLLDADQEWAPRQ